MFHDFKEKEMGERQRGIGFCEPSPAYRITDSFLCDRTVGDDAKKGFFLICIIIISDFFKAFALDFYFRNEMDANVYGRIRKQVG